MKLTKALTGRRIAKDTWPTGIAERLLYVGSEWVITQSDSGKENVSTYNPKDDDWSVAPLNDSDMDYVDLAKD